MGDVRKLPDDDPDGRRTLGMLLFLASWSVMFVGLMVFYAVVRNDAPVWPPPGLPHLPIILPTVATGVLAVSTVTMESAVRSLREANLAGMRRGVMLTFVLAFAFLVLQSISWMHLWREGVHAAGIYGGTFYVITWFHGIHVVVALGLLAVLLAGARAGRYSARGLAPVRMTAMFWHFLGASWLGIYLGLYLT